MWADNETRVDLLGFDFLVDELLVVLRDPRLLPITVGVAGDWGSGKSSLLGMTEMALADEKVLTERPLVRLALLRSAPLVRSNVCALLLFGGATVFNVVNTLYEQNVLGWSPLKTGAVFMVASITTGLLAPRVGPITTRIGPTWVVLAGALAMAGSYLLFLATGTTTNYAVIVAALALTGAGFAFAYPALNIQALSGVADEEQGLASGLVGSAFQIGGAIVLAVSTAATLASTPAHATPAQTVHGLHAGMSVGLVGAGAIALISATSLVMQRRNARDQTAEVPGSHPFQALDEAA